MAFVCLGRYCMYGYDSVMTSSLQLAGVIDNMDFTIVPQNAPDLPDEVSAHYYMFMYVHTLHRCRLKRYLYIVSS